MTIKRDWTIFEGRPYGAKKSGEVRVTLNDRGVFYLSKGALNALEQPAAVELRYDGNRRLIGMKAIDPRRKNAFPIHGDKIRLINAAAFCKHFRLRVEGTNFFDGADLTPEGILELPLDSMITVGRGAR